MEQFSYEANGYNREEVNKFLNDVVHETEHMAELYKEQEQQINHLQEKISRYETLETQIKDAVTNEASDQIILAAKKDASEIINDALKRAEEVDAQRRLLEKNMEIFKKKLKLILEQQHIIVEKIDELEIEDK